VEGACPFECCTYREWTARNSFPVYASERDTTNVTFTIGEGESFSAMTGNVHVTQLGLVHVLEPFSPYSRNPDGALFQAGDTLIVLDYLGEGGFMVWYRGELLAARGYWLPEARITEANRDRVPGVLIQEAETEWWVMVRTQNGRTGWIRMREARVANADACA
jgi:hypothetical protein